jgi:hypothetical protein
MKLEHVWPARFQDLKEQRAREIATPARNETMPADSMAETVPVA